MAKKLKIWSIRFNLLLIAVLISTTVSASDLDSLQQLLNQKDDTNKVETYNKIAKLYLKHKDFENAKLNFKSSYELSKKLNYEFGEIAYYHHLGILYSRVVNFDSSSFYFNKALQSNMYQARIDTKLNLLNDYGLLYYYTGKYDEAIKLYLKALSENKFNNEDISVLIYNNIGNCYYFLSDNNNALKYYKKALVINRKQQNKLRVSYNLGNIGLIYYNLGMLTEALNSHLESYQVQKELKDTAEMAASLINMGIVYQDQKEYKKFLEVTLESLRLRRLLKDQKRTLVSLNHAGYALHLNKRDHEAIAMLEEALAIATKLKLYKPLQEASQYLYLIYKENKKFEKALGYMEDFKHYSDTIFNDNYTKEIAEAQEKYESVERDRELILLQKDQTIKQIALDKNKKMLWASIILVSLLILMLLLLYNRFQLKRKSNNLLSSQNLLITAQKKEITDSIKYSSIIQSAILPLDKDLLQLFPNSFKYYKPKDIVSGDFYWVGYKNELKIIVVADCTGHGVPGAMMSMIGINLLNQAIHDKNIVEPHLILEFIDSNIAQLLHQNMEWNTTKHSMDLSLCLIDSKNKIMHYGGSINSIYYFTDELQILKTDKIPLGYNHSSDKKTFNSYRLNYKSGDRIYLLTDGIVDQFGGPNDKKLLSKKWKDFLIQIQGVKITEQYALIANFIEEWQGNFEQTDDMALIGIELS